MENKRIIILVSDFNSQITDSLLEACQETLYKAGFGESQLKVIRVPGAFELPVIAAKAARMPQWDAVICLGCVIKGETPHFDYICQEAARGMMSIALETEKPIIFGVLTTNTMEQAMARSGLKQNSYKDAFGIKKSVENKGIDSAQAALQMLSALDQLKESS